MLKFINRYNTIYKYPCKFFSSKVKISYIENNDFYKILEVPDKSNEKEIRGSFLKLAKKFHPDIYKGDQEKFKKINIAYETLKDKETRKKYDDAKNEYFGLNKHENRNSNQFYYKNSYQQRKTQSTNHNKSNKHEKYKESHNNYNEESESYSKNQTFDERVYEEIFRKAMGKIIDLDNIFKNIRREHLKDLSPKVNYEFSKFNPIYERFIFQPQNRHHIKNRMKNFALKKKIFFHYKLKELDFFNIDNELHNDPDFLNSMNKLKDSDSDSYSKKIIIRDLKEICPLSLKVSLILMLFTILLFKKLKYQ